jgi:hypothetical protein
MATRKYTKVGATRGYAHLAKNLGQSEPDAIFEGYVNEYAYGKKGKTFTTHNLRSWKNMSFWLGEEAYSDKQ